MMCYTKILHRFAEMCDCGGFVVIMSIVSGLGTLRTYTVFE